MITVVVAAYHERALLDACLASLRAQCTSHGAALIVARACSDAELETLQHDYPEVLFVPAPRDATIPQVRARGLAAAEGDLVVLTEDHCVVAPDWLAQMSAAASGHDVVAGSLDNAQRARTTDWAAFFAEYGPYSVGAAADGTPVAASANVAYGRSVIGEVVALAAAGEWENVIHRTLAERGRSFVFLRGGMVSQNASHGFWEFSRNRFAHGRQFAQRRLAGLRRVQRWTLLAGSGLLPGLLTWRVSRGLEPHHRRPFLRALPITFAFLTAWSAGEAWGYLRAAPAEEALGA